jgi:hypothetical protein
LCLNYRLLGAYRRTAQESAAPIDMLKMRLAAGVLETEHA